MAGYVKTDVNSDVTNQHEKVGLEMKTVEPCDVHMAKQILLFCCAAIHKCCWKHSLLVVSSCNAHHSFFFLLVLILLYGRVKVGKVQVTCVGSAQKHTKKTYYENTRKCVYCVSHALFTMLCQLSKLSKTLRLKKFVSPLLIVVR